MSRVVDMTKKIYFEKSANKPKIERIIIPTKSAVPDKTVSKLPDIIIKYCKGFKCTLSDVENIMIEYPDQINQILKTDHKSTNNLISLIFKHAYNDKIIALVELFLKYGGMIDKIDFTTITNIFMNVDHDNIFQIIKLTDNPKFYWKIISYLRKNDSEINILLFKNIFKYISTLSNIEYKYDKYLDIFKYFIRVYDDNDFLEIFRNVFFNNEIIEKLKQLSAEDIKLDQHIYKNATVLVEDDDDDNNLALMRHIRSIFNVPLNLSASRGIEIFNKLLQCHDEHNVLVCNILNILDDLTDHKDALKIFVDYLKQKQKISDDDIMKLLYIFFKSTSTYSENFELLIDVGFLPTNIKSYDNYPKLFLKIVHAYVEIFNNGKKIDEMTKYIHVLEETIKCHPDSLYVQELKENFESMAKQ